MMAGATRKKVKYYTEDQLRDGLAALQAASSMRLRDAAASQAWSAPTVVLISAPGPEAIPVLAGFTKGMKQTFGERMAWHLDPARAGSQDLVWHIPPGSVPTAEDHLMQFIKVPGAACARELAAYVKRMLSPRYNPR